MDEPFRVVVVEIGEAEVIFGARTIATAVIIHPAADTIARRPAAITIEIVEATVVVVPVAALIDPDSNIVHRPIDFHAKLTIDPTAG